MKIDKTKMQLLTWTIEDQLFGLEIGKCREVDRDVRITDVPHSKKFISGIVNLRGDVVTVLDLRVLLNYDGKSETDRNVIIRLKSDGSNIAIKADKVSDIVEVEESNIEDAGVHLNENESKYIQSVGITDKGLVLILSPESILNIKD